MSNGRAFVVMDVGGTTVRTGRYVVEPGRPGGGRLTAVRRVPTAGIARHRGAEVAALQELVVEQVVGEADRALRQGSGEALAVAFAGPVNAVGEVLAAPTIWGGGGQRLPLAGLLRDRLGVPVLVVNDLTAAVWRYVDGPDEPPFCLITVSSGIGNKVYWHGRVLLDDEGYGGELGHWRCDPDPAAPVCDCGGRGHLGAIASGRGMLAATRAAGRADPAGYAQSILAAASPDPDRLQTEAIAAAVRAGDPFATRVLRAALRHLSTAITAVYTAIGVRRFVIIGGFATAVGEAYPRLLTSCLVEAGCFSLDPSQIASMVRLGYADDDHGLVGAGRLLAAGTSQVASISQVASAMVGVAG
jgi:predicted NBD/HSP70 family sugar kinase